MNLTIHTYAGWLFYFVTGWHVIAPTCACWLNGWQVVGAAACCAAVTWLADCEDE